MYLKGKEEPETEIGDGERYANYIVDGKYLVSYDEERATSSVYTVCPDANELVENKYPGLFLTNRKFGEVLLKATYRFIVLVKPSDSDFVVASRLRDDSESPSRNILALLEGDENTHYIGDLNKKVVLELKDKIISDELVIIKIGEASGKCSPAEYKGYDVKKLLGLEAGEDGFICGSMRPLGDIPVRNGVAIREFKDGVAIYDLSTLRAYRYSKKLKTFYEYSFTVNSKDNEEFSLYSRDDGIEIHKKYKNRYAATTFDITRKSFSTDDIVKYILDNPENPIDK